MEIPVFLAVIFLCLAIVIQKKEILLLGSVSILMPICALVLGGSLYWGLNNKFIQESYYLLIGYLCIFYLAYIAGVNSRDTPKVLTIFLFIIFFSGLIQIGIGLAQWSGQLVTITLDNWWAMSGNIGERVSSNFGQTNNYATFILWSYLAFLTLNTWLEDSGILITKGTVAFVTLFFAFGLVLAQSRTSLVSILIVIMAVGYSKVKLRSNLKFALTILVLSFGIFWFLIPLFSNLIVPQVDASARSFVDSNLRFPGWGMFITQGLSSLQQAIFGSGWGSIGVVHVNAAGSESAVNFSSAIFAQSHNIFLDIFICFGIIGLLIFLRLIYICIQKFNLLLSNERFLILGLMVLVFFVHSNFEFPHYYAYFLMPAGYLLGTVSQSSNAMKTKTIYLLPILLVSLIAVVLVVKDYTKFERGFLSDSLQVKLQGKINTTDYYVSSLLPGLSELQASSRMIVNSQISPSEADRIYLLAKHYPSTYNLARAVEASAFRSDEQVFRFFSQVFCIVGGNQPARYYMQRATTWRPELNSWVISENCRLTRD